MTAPPQGNARISNVRFKENTVGLRIGSPVRFSRDLELSNLRFDQPGGIVLAANDELVDLDEEADGLLIPQVALQDRITLSQPGQAKVGLFFEEQAANYVPVPEDSEYADVVARQMVGLTNSQLQQRFGTSFGGAILPAGAAKNSVIASGGYVGKPRPSLPAETQFGGLFDPETAFEVVR